MSFLGTHRRPKLSQTSLRFSSSFTSRDEKLTYCTFSSFLLDLLPSLHNSHLVLPQMDGARRLTTDHNQYYSFLVRTKKGHPVPVILPKMDPLSVLYVEVPFRLRGVVYRDQTSHPRRYSRSYPIVGCTSILRFSTPQLSQFHLLPRLKSTRISQETSIRYKSVPVRNRYKPCSVSLVERHGFHTHITSGGTSFYVEEGWDREIGG